MRIYELFLALFFVATILFGCTLEEQKSITLLEDIRVFVDREGYFLVFTKNDEVNTVYARKESTKAYTNLAPEKNPYAIVDYCGNYQWPCSAKIYIHSIHDLDPGESIYSGKNTYRKHFHVLE